MPHCAGTPRGWQYLHSVLGGQVRGIPPAVEQGDEPKATRQIPGEPLRCLGCRHHLHHSRDAGVVQRGVEVNGLEERQEGRREGISELLARTRHTASTAERTGRRRRRCPFRRTCTVPGPPKASGWVCHGLQEPLSPSSTAQGRGEGTGHRSPPRDRIYSGVNLSIKDSLSRCPRENICCNHRLSGRDNRERHYHIIPEK